MTGYTEPDNKKPEDNKDVKPTETTNPPDTTKVEAKGDSSLDDFGYEKPKEEPAKDASKKDEELKEGVKEPATGYEKPPEAPPKEEKVITEPAKDDKPAPPPEEFQVEDPGELHDDEIKEIKEFVKNNKLSKEVGKALVEAKKKEIVKLKEWQSKNQVEQTNAQKKIRVQWYNELKADPDFGGEKFDHSVKRVDKFLEEFMPNMKKRLTETKAMMPPNVMKDFLAVANKLYEGINLPQGEKASDKEDPKAEDDGLAFYNS